MLSFNKSFYHKDERELPETFRAVDLCFSHAVANARLCLNKMLSFNNSFYHKDERELPETFRAVDLCFSHAVANAQVRLNKCR